VPAAEVLPTAWQECKQQVGLVIGTIQALVSQNVSAKELGGPVMIAQVTMQAAELGWERLFRTTAFISLNLFILNLLPLPVLDGGQIVVNLIEAIRRKPLSFAIQERIQQVGVVMLIALMLFVTWNDVNRIIGSLIPGQM
jgi:regulator of sigma E protease